MPRVSLRGGLTLALHGKVFLVSIRDIEPSEELFVSYGDGYWA